MTLKDFLQPIASLWFSLTLDKRGGVDLKEESKVDPRTFVLLGAAGYRPKHTSLSLPTLSVKNQIRQNSCVAESAAAQKEPDEGVVLSAQGLSAYLYKNGQMSSRGSTLIAAQKAMQKWGIPEERFFDDRHTSSFNDFASEEQLTPEVNENASEHKIDSYWYTTQLNAILEQLDNGRIGHTALMWYSGYNVPPYPCILEPRSGYQVYGHAVIITGYNLNYNGFEVLELQNSYSTSWGSNGKFYIKFSDFYKILEYSTYFNLDVPKDIAKWLHEWKGKAILEKNSPKVWFIENDKKRYIPDEALMFMLGFSAVNIIKDKENLLPQVKEGPEMTVQDVLPGILDFARNFVSASKDKTFIKDRFEKYFPDLFKK